MKQYYTAYATVTRTYRYGIVIEDGAEEEDEPTHEQFVALNEKLDEIEQTLGDYLENELNPEHFLLNHPKALPEIKSVHFDPSDDDWSLEVEQE